MYEFNKEYILTLHCHIIITYFVQNNKNDVLFEWAYIETKRLIFTFSFIGNFGRTSGVGSQRTLFTNHEGTSAQCASLFLSVMSLTLFMYMLVLSSPCFAERSLVLTP